MRLRSVLVTAAMIGCGVSAVTGGATATAQDGQSAIVDDHEYLGAAEIQAQYGIRLVKGDGRLLFEPDCAKPDVIQVFSLKQTSAFCFRTTGRSGHVGLELPDTYGVRSNSYALAITARVDGVSERVDLPPHSWAGIGKGEDESNGPATLLELRSTQVDPVEGPESDRTYAFVAKIVFPQRSCTGALVDAEWVLTAKRCFDGQQPTTATAIVGRTTLTGTRGQEVQVSAFVPHPDRDVALARLATPVTLSSAQPVPLAQTPPAVGDQVRAAGFGRTRTAWAPDALHVETFQVTGVAAGTVAMVGHTPADAVTCAGDAGGPSLREVAGRLELVGLHHTSAQTGCVGAAGTGSGVTETRVDDLRSWVMAATLAHVPWAGRADTGPALHQSRSATGAWSGFTTVNGYLSAVPAGAKDVAVTGLPDGSSQLVVVGSDDRVYHRVRSAGGVWSDFTKLVHRTQSGNVIAIREAVAKRVAIAGLPDGSTQVVMISSDDRVQHRVRAADGTWSEFATLNGAGTTEAAKGKDIAITGLANGTAQVLIVGWNDGVHHRVRNTDGTWTEFATINGPGTTETATAKRLSIASTPDNSAQVVIVGTDDKVYHRARFANGTWSPFYALNGSGTADPAKGKDVAVAGLPDGSAQVLIVGWDGRAYHRVRSLSGAWTEFTAVAAAGSTAGTPVKQVSLGGLPDNSSQLLVVG